MRQFVSIDSSDQETGSLYDLLVAAVQPRPIALVSTLGPDGVPNLAPFSFFMAGGVNPPSLAFSTTQGAHGPKDTLTNIAERGEFVINTVHREMAPGMNAASLGYPSEVSEWSASGFTMLPSERVAPPRVAESMVQFECRLYEIVRHGDGVGSANYVIGEVVRAHVAEEIWNGRAIRQGALRLIARLGGPFYVDTAALEVFELVRPTQAAAESD